MKKRREGKGGGRGRGRKVGGWEGGGRGVSASSCVNVAERDFFHFFFYLFVYSCLLHIFLIILEIAFFFAMIFGLWQLLCIFRFNSIISKSIHAEIIAISAKNISGLTRGRGQLGTDSGEKRGRAV